MIRKIDLNSLFAGLLYALLAIAMGVNGFYLLTGGEATHLTYLAHYASEAQAPMLGYFSALFYLTGVLMLLAVALVVASLLRKEFIATESDGIWLRRSLLTAIGAVLIYGFMVRMYGNNDAAAELYFYVVLLYMALWYVESSWQPRTDKCIFHEVKSIPILLLLMFSLGLPGVKKLLAGTAGMAGYEQMFAGSIFAEGPGGVVPFMYVIAVMETLTSIVALVALVKGEFRVGGKSTFFKWSLVLGMATFTALSLGMTVIGYFPGATNLVFYALLTLSLYAYLHRSGIVDTSLR